MLTPLERWRSDKDDYLLRHPGSPLRGSPGFAGLAYYPEDPGARVVARVERTPGAPAARLSTSSGEERTFIEYGVARFQLAGVERSLTLFAPLEEPEGPRLFLPFKDATSGNETYGAGRYLDPVLDPAAPGSLLLDFNYAYHPLCAYAEGYSCAYPPPGNRLEAPVRAGERLPG